MYIIILVSVFSASTAMNIISKEEKDKTAEFLLTKPISRANIFFTKLYSLFTLGSIIFLIQTIAAYLGILIYGEDNISFHTFIIMQSNGFLLLLFFTCFAILLSMLMPPKNNFMGLVVGIVFGSYFLDAISKITYSLNWIGYFSPYHYFGFKIKDPNYSVNLINLLFLIIFCISAIYFAYRIYKNRDISA